MSMAPTTVRLVLVEGENADGATVDQENFALAGGDEAAASAPDQVMSAILGTREGAAEAGYELVSIGVTWTDQRAAAVLRDALAARKIENVMLVSAFLAAAALAQSVGNSIGYRHTALLFVEPDTATLAAVDSTDGSIAEVRREVLPDDDDEAVAKVAELASGAQNLEGHPDGVVVVGSGVDIPLIKPVLEAATPLPLSAPEEPDTALARGAALASANAPLFASSTAAVAYAHDPGTGNVDPYLLELAYRASADAPAAADTGEGLAYSAVGDADAGPLTGAVADDLPAEQPSRRPFLVAMSVLTIFVVGVVTLVISLAVSIRPSVEDRPSLSQNVITPHKQSPPAPLPKAHVPPPPAAAAPAPAPAAAPVPAAPPAATPAPVQVPAAVPAPAPPPVNVRVPAPALPPVVAPPPPPPALPPIPPILPRIFSPPVLNPPLAPRGGDHGRGGWDRGRGDHGRGGGHGHGGWGHIGGGWGHGGFGGFGGGHGRGHR
ncbi:hypothetical protein AWC26_08295 [Mycobacterium shimoidei]|nr:hypothetical protein BHQ16_10630 [Mycobacterium shimoidei]ORW81679.1 hypothetical protein AWC26_08295 [Mycobacterium shimoidei]